LFLDFYHLREQPFGVTPDPAYLYPSRTHCEALDSLTEGILGDQGFLALIAEPGMGKTTLLYQVLERLRDTARAVFLFQTQCDSREFFQYLLSELGVDSTAMGRVAMHKKLNEMLFAEMLEGKRFVLIIDEAQNLDDSVLETVRLLSNFETSHTKLLQIVLAGQPQLGEKLGQKGLAQLLQRITVAKHLEALSREETAGYIRHRLKVAGHCGETLFEPEALTLVAERSQGVPRNINKICFHALLEAHAEGRYTVSRDIVEKADRKLDVVAAARPTPTPMPAPSPAPSPAPLRARIPLKEPTFLRRHGFTYKPLIVSTLASLAALAIAVMVLAMGLASYIGGQKSERDQIKESQGLQAMLESSRRALDESVSRATQQLDGVQPGVISATSHPAAKPAAKSTSTSPLAPDPPLPAAQPAVRSTAPDPPLPAAQPAVRSTAPDPPLPAAQPMVRSTVPDPPLPAVQPAVRSTAPDPPLPAAQPAAKSTAPDPPLPAAQPAAKSSSHKEVDQRQPSESSFIPPRATVLQVAAYVREADALALAETLTQKKFPVFVLPPRTDNFYRVTVGPYGDAQSMKIAQQQLEAEGFKSIVKH
jgi:type II secretory pathway predicted ATPase ExeA